MYRVLYRKWRPAMFSDVVGQEQVTTTLKNEISSGRLSHAYLFVGSRGTGKTTCAKILAKAANCLNPQNGDPCNECEICRGIDNGSVVDVVEIDAASNNGVDNIRVLREEVNYNPAMAKYRVYIIDEVHMLSMGAYNALLKTLEEPPEHVIFILATTEAHKLPATILSRCQRFNFNRISPSEISKRVKFVSENEGISITDDASLLIARLADGAMRDALSILDQCAGKTSDITEASVSEVVGLVGRDHLFKISRAVHDEDTDYLINFIDSLYAASADMERFCSEMCEFFRNCLICKVGSSDLITSTKEEKEKYKEAASGFTVSQLLMFLDKIRQTQDKLKLSLNRRVDMEMLLISLSKPKLSTDVQSLLARIETLENRLRTIGSAPVAFEHTESVDEVSNVASAEAENAENGKCDIPRAKSDCFNKQEETAPERDASEGQADVKHSAADMKSRSEGSDEPFVQWPEVLEEIKKLNRPLSAIMLGSKAYIRGAYVLIDAPNQSFKDYIKKNSLAMTIVEAVARVSGKNYKLGIYKSNLSEQSDKPKDALNDFTERAKKLGIDVKID